VVSILPHCQGFSCRPPSFIIFNLHVGLLCTTRIPLPTSAITLLFCISSLTCATLRRFLTLQNIQNIQHKTIEISCTRKHKTFPSATDYCVSLDELNYNILACSISGLFDYMNMLLCLKKSLFTIFCLTCLQHSTIFAN
jgi:hypothetical protein